MTNRWRHRHAVAITVLLAAMPALSVDVAELDAESSRLRKELQQIQGERQRNKEDMAKEKKELDAYRTRTTKCFSDMRTETEAIKAETQHSNTTRDSLAALVELTQSRRRQIELNEDQLRIALIGACAEAVGAARALPPMAGQQAAASAGLLKAELEGKSIDNIEAMNRIVQIYGRFDDAVASIQVSQETSPFAEVRGTVYRLRIGTMFEALVDMKGEKGALWKGAEPNGAARWKMVDASEAAMLLKAASIREGKSLPGFAQLPFDTTGGAR